MLGLLFFSYLYPGYGWFHAIGGGAVASMIIAFSMYLARGYAARVTRIFRLKQNSSFGRILLTSFLGVYIHILLDLPTMLVASVAIDLEPGIGQAFGLLDAPLHALYDLRVPDMEFTPTRLGIYSLCTLSFFAGLALYKRRATQCASRMK